MLPVLSVSEFIFQINGIIAGEFIIEGEVSQYKISQGKWIFFDLKDEGGTLNCFSTLYMLPQPLEDGMKVRVTGYPKIHDKSGRFSFTVQRVEVVGEGGLRQAYELLKKKLTAEGLFDASRKREIPRMPERIGVIASSDSAAWGDFRRILGNRWGGVEVVLRHVQVQGEGAIADIVEAFKEFNEDGPFDVLVLIRGGGSLEDLAAFNSEPVVRAIHASRTPVVVGVGHERDETLADFAADVRASTPSNAAELVVPDRQEFSSQLDFMLEQMMGELEHKLHRSHDGLDRMLERMSGAMDDRLRYLSQFLDSTETLFRNLHPNRILERGFSITRTSKGKIIKSSAEVDVGQEIVVELAKGRLVSEIKEIRNRK